MDLTNEKGPQDTHMQFMPLCVCLTIVTLELFQPVHTHGARSVCAFAHVRRAYSLLYILNVCEGSWRGSSVKPYTLNS